MCFDVPIWWCGIAYLVTLVLPFVAAGTVLATIAFLINRTLECRDRKRTQPSLLPSEESKSMNIQIEHVLACVVVVLTYVFAAYSRLGNTAAYVGGFIFGALIFIHFVRHKRR
jgi:hypothetical protein